MFPAKVVKNTHDPVWGEKGVAIFFAFDFKVGEFGNIIGKIVVFESHDITVCEEALNIFRSVGRILGGDGKNIHLFVCVG